MGLDSNQSLTMPHKIVATFFRSHSNSFDLPRADKKATRSYSGFTASRPSLSDRTFSSTSSVNSSDTNGSMPDSSRRLSMVMNSPKIHAKANAAPQIPAKLNVEIESPPLMFYGTAAASTGALLSGQLKLNIAEQRMAIESFEMTLVVSVKMKKPFHAHCPECAHQSTELTTWSFLQGPSSLKKGIHDFPFSFLLPGHLPATMHGSLSVIDYVLKAVVTPKVGDKIWLQKELVVKRAIQPAEVPRQSIRIFPPTNLTSHVELPSVIHPIGEFSTSFRLDGIVKRNVDTQTQTQWKLKRLTWRLDETQKVISPACTKHALKAGALPLEKKGLAHQDVRTLNSEEIKSGWKADYSNPDGSIEMIFPFSIRSDAKPVCDVKAEDGTEVSHALVIEMIVAEEFAPIKKPTQATPTGAARVLRMHFNVTVTERSGLGISWDEEQPPLYDDVPVSPPGYGNVQVADTVVGETPEYEELDHLRN